MASDVFVRLFEVVLGRYSLPNKQLRRQSLLSLLQSVCHLMQFGQMDLTIKSEVGADSREDLLNGQVNQLNFKESGKLFQTKGVMWRKTENQAQKEKVPSRRFGDKTKNLELLAARGAWSERI